MSENYSCFKAYDVRGRVPDQLNETIVYRIGRAYAQYLGAQRIVVGHDIRLTSPALCDAAIAGIREAGSNVVHIGQCGTEEIYFATFNGAFDGGVMVTASHNPKSFNGLKMVRQQARPISGDDGLPKIKAIAEQGEFYMPTAHGLLTRQEDKGAYIQHLLTYIEIDILKPLKVVVNAGNGGAGHIVDLLEPLLPFEFIKVHHQADGRFPNGVPNPLLPENRAVTAARVVENGADLGIAWDGDFDRCFFFDEKGEFIESYYLVGLLAELFLRKSGPAAVVHDPRLTWNTIAMVNQLHGRAIQSKTGHAFIKQVMRDHDAIYGGEMSAHHYFKDFAYCDSGMIPWLVVAELLSRGDKTLSQLVAQCRLAYPVSGEINRPVGDAEKALGILEAHYATEVLAIEKIDGLSMEFADWRFNVRASNTEPLLRLNVESRGNVELTEIRTAEILSLLDN
jgi:phosphomannomutase